jgi:predicted peptidase
MGGYGTWTLAAAYPDRFAAIAPICGGGKAFMAYRLKDVPVWAFHGAKDNVVPVKESEELVNAIKARGGDAKLTVYPDAGHDSWTATYNNQELYDWFLKHRISDRAK